jgi:hypothetical protein
VDVDRRRRRSPTSPAAARGSGFFAADVPRAVRSVLAVPGGARGDPAGGRAPVGVLPGGVAVQVRQQALHAVTCASIRRQLRDE